jgi:HNH endonuclease
VADLLDRIADKIEFAPDGCWNVGKYRSKIYISDKPTGGGKVNEWIYRALWKETVGNLTKGNVLDHLCRNELCVNPDHLEEVSPRENSVRGMRNLDNVGTCRSGKHQWITENIYVHKNQRRCKPCTLAKNKELLSK